MPTNTITDWDIINYVLTHRGSNRGKDVAAALEISQSSASRRIAGLVEAGVLQRDNHHRLWAGDELYNLTVLLLDREASDLAGVVRAVYHARDGLDSLQRKLFQSDNDNNSQPNVRGQQSDFESPLSSESNDRPRAVFSANEDKDDDAGQDARQHGSTGEHGSAGAHGSNGQGTGHAPGGASGEASQPTASPDLVESRESRVEGQSSESGTQPSALSTPLPDSLPSASGGGDFPNTSPPHLLTYERARFSIGQNWQGMNVVGVILSACDDRHFEGGEQLVMLSDAGDIRQLAVTQMTIEADDQSSLGGSFRFTSYP